MKAPKPRVPPTVPPDERRSDERPIPRERPTLREFIEFQVRAERELRHGREESVALAVELQVRHERELREASERFTSQALQLQAVENQRRFEDLNGEYGRIREILGQTVSRELFEARVTPLERQTNRWSGGTALVVTGIAAAAGVLGIAAFVVGRS